jgi:hypothetical protein
MPEIGEKRTFLELIDTPSSYSAQSGKVAKVNATEDGIEFGAGGGGGMEVHDNDYHQPDFEQEGVAAALVGIHRTTETHTQAQPAAPHNTSHQDGGSDKISAQGLSGELADLQKVKNHNHQSAGSGIGGKLDHGLALDGLGDDDHNQYLNDDRHDTTVRHPIPSVVPHDNFLGLTDTPGSYSGHGGKVISVKSDVSGLEFTTPGAGTGFTYTAVNPPAETSPASASAWLDWDLSSIIPGGAKYAVVFIRSNSSTAYYGMVRKKNQTEITATIYLRYYAIVTMIVELDANRVCQRYATNIGLKFGVLGYIT